MKRARIIAVLLVLCSIPAVGQAFSQQHNDGQPYNQFVTIRGSVTMTDPESHKTSIPTGLALIFQRTDCKRCLVVAVTNLNGEYELHVGKGKYRLIVRDCGLPSYDCVAPDQPRIVNAKNGVVDNVFDIRLVRHATPFDMILPENKKPAPSGNDPDKVKRVR